MQANETSTHQTQVSSTVRPSLLPTRAAPGANATAPRPRAARPAKPPANAVGCTNRTTAITSAALPMSSASGSGARPTRATGDARPLAAPDALQDDLAPQETQEQPLDDGIERRMRYKMPSSCNPLLLVGLIAHLTGLSLQEDIALTARRLQQLGRDILCGSPHATRRHPGCTNAPSRWPNSDACPTSSAGWISAWSVSAISISSAMRPAPSISSWSPWPMPRA